MAKRKTKQKPATSRRYVKVQEHPATWVHARVTSNPEKLRRQFMDASDTVVRNGQAIPKNKLHSDNLTLNEDAK